LKTKYKTMKKVILLLASVLVGLSAYAQGTLDFNNKNNNTTPPINAPVSLAGGALLSGTDYFVQMFAGPAGTAASALAAQGIPINFRTGAAAGYFSGGSVAITGVDFGATATVQIRAWAAASGATYAAAVAANGIYGSSTAFNVATPAYPDRTAPPPLPGSLIGLTSFSISSGTPIVPEPTTIALGLLGAALLFIRRRQ
jgi:hypothetical protein